MLTTDTNGSGDSFYLSYLTAKSDVDYYKFPVPAGRFARDLLSEPPARGL